MSISLTNISKPYLNHTIYIHKCDQLQDCLLNGKCSSYLTAISGGSEIDKIKRQAGAELCQAQVKFS